MVDTVIASDGIQIPLESLLQTFAFSGGFLSTITVVYTINSVANTYVQTFTNNGTNITVISGWVKQ